LCHRAHTWESGSLSRGAGYLKGVPYLNLKIDMGKVAGENCPARVAGEKIVTLYMRV
jgi:hypothetical protein